MNCKRCGTTLSNEATRCYQCGLEDPIVSWQKNSTKQPQKPQYAQPQQYAQSQPQYAQPRQYVQPKCSQPQPKSVTTVGDKRATMSDMAWHNVVIYALLFLMAGANAFIGYIFITGDIYEGADGFLYTFIDGLEQVDLIFAIANFAMAIFTIYVRSQLSGLKKDSGSYLNAVFSLDLILITGYNMIVCGLAGEDIWKSFENEYFLMVFAGLVVIHLINSNYYKKRKHLFVN